MNAQGRGAVSVARENDSGTATLKKPRVLMTTSTLPRWPNDAEPSFVLQLATALAPRFDITILAPHAPGSRCDEHISGVHIHRYRYAPERWQSLAYEGGMVEKLCRNPLRWLLLPGFLLAQLLAMVRLHGQRHYDLMHIHWIIPQGLVAALLKRLGFMKVPALLTSHGSDLWALKGIDWLKRWVLASMDSVSVVSRAMAPECERLGVLRERIFVRSMGVDLRGRFTSTLRFEQRHGVVFVGRLVNRKGLKTLLRAFSLVHEHDPNQRLTIVGGGPLRETLERLSAELGCRSAVDFVGAVANEQVPAYLNRARIAVVPSEIEGLGLVAVEAMGCGCAVVCSDLPAFRDVLTNDESGVVFKPGDELALAAILRELLENPDHTSRLAAAGRDAVVDRFDWSAVADAYAARYQDLLDVVSPTIEGHG